MENGRRLGKAREYELHPDIKFWKGPDIRLVGSAEIPPKKRRIIQIRLEQDNLLFTDNEFLENTYASTRSRLAQLGISVPEFGKQIIKALEVSGQSSPTFPFDADVEIDNYSHVPVYMSKNMRVFRAYHQKPEARVTGEQLKRLRDEGKIYISGEEGKDWQWKADRGEVTGIMLRINPESRKWVRSFSGPITINDDAQDYRATIDQRLEKIPSYGVENGILVIATLVAHIGFASGIDGILNPVIVQNRDGKSRYIGAHIDSHLIDGGKKPWEIRVEYLSHSEPESIDDEWATLYAVAA